MTDNAVAIPDSGYAIAEQVIIKGDLSKLTEQQRMDYYTAVCRSLDLNPLTRPFEYIILNGKLTLYPTKAATDQLRVTRGVSIVRLDRETTPEGTYDVTAYGRDRTGREDASLGSVYIAGLKGDPLSNAKMKAETKAKRRLTLSLSGLGWVDESEVESIPSAEPAAPRLSLAERAAQKRAGLDDVHRAEVIAAQDAPIMAGPMTEEASDELPYIEGVAAPPDDPEGLTPAAFADLARLSGVGKIAMAGALDVTPDKVAERIKAMDDAARYRLAQSLGIVP